MKQDFVPIVKICRMWGLPKRTVQSWINRSASGEMQNHPLPEGSYRKDELTGMWMLSADSVQTKLGKAPTWTLDQVLADEDKKHEAQT